ncbi:hypothetical protein AAFX24_22160 [Vibrio mediterranei]|uniref:hypothetical protein n=1 Tax=Vibrio mediterranei TaxID=689 RepID=UPI0038CE6E4A
MSTKNIIYELNRKQHLFVGYTLAILVDLCVICFFDQYWDLVSISSFTIAFISATLLQVLLKFSIQFERKIASHFATKEGVIPKILRAICSYIVLVGSKFLMLEVLNVSFGDKIQFTGPWNGVIAFITVVFSILAAEKIIGLIYSNLENSTTAMN